jgi:hypothetical protein
VIYGEDENHVPGPMRLIIISAGSDATAEKTGVCHLMHAWMQQGHPQDVGQFTWVGISHG